MFHCYTEHVHTPLLHNIHPECNNVVNYSMQQLSGSYTYLCVKALVHEHLHAVCVCVCVCVCVLKIDVHVNPFADTAE